MIFEGFNIPGNGARDGGCDNVISFAAYVARHGRKRSGEYAGQPLEGQIIYLVNRRII